MNGSNALETIESGRPQFFYPENNGREGLFLNLQALSVAAFGHDEFALRFPAAIFGILTVWGLYSLGAELLSVPAGLVAAFFLATSFWHLDFSRLGLRAIAAPFFLVWALYLLLRAGGRVMAGRSSAALTISAGVVYGLGFHTYIAYRVTPPLLLGVIIFFFFRARATGSLPQYWVFAAIFCAAAVLTVLPLALYFVQHPAMFSGRSAQVSILNAPAIATNLVENAWKTAQMFFFSGDPNWRHNYDGERELFWPVALLFAFGLVRAALAVRDWIRKPREQGRLGLAAAVALTWLVLAAIPAILADSAPHALRALLTTPAVFLLAAMGAMAAWDYVPASLGGAARAGILALGAGFCCYQTWHTYFDLWARDPRVPVNFMAPLDDFAARIRGTPTDRPRYIAATYMGDRANGIPVLLQPFAYLTGTYTAKQQNAANLHYLTPESLPSAPAGNSFCEHAKASLPGAEVLCLNLRSGK